MINYLSEKSYNSNNKYNFNKLIKKLLEDEKIIALDVGAQGGFNSDNFFPRKYNEYFEDILIEPIKEEAEKLKNLLSIKGSEQKENKKLFILDNRTWKFFIVSAG